MRKKRKKTIIKIGDKDGMRERMKIRHFGSSSYFNLSNN